MQPCRSCRAAALSSAPYASLPVCFCLMKSKPLPALSIAAETTATSYPAPFASQVAGRSKRKLGNVFGLTRFGVNLTELAPGAVSALKHHHAVQDEFIYILSGAPTLVLDDETFTMQAGDCYGFARGAGVAHQLRNDSDETVRYIEIGDRTAGDRVIYPDDDLCATMDDNGHWVFTHKDGRPY